MFFAHRRAVFQQPVKGGEYHLWLRNRQALYGVTNLVLAPGYGERTEQGVVTAMPITRICDLSDRHDRKEPHHG